MAIKVTCSLPKGRKGYTVNFRHTVIMDKEGKYGLKVHRGIGTSDEAEAEKLVMQLENILNNDYWWDISKKNEAYNHFSSVVVDIFYDPMETVSPDEKYLLDKIPLPGKQDGYTTTTIVGPSGAGKTSLLRMIAGTVKEKFPTTSTGRTTTCNMELIMSENEDYEVVITFMSRYLFEMYVQECIEAAMGYCISEKCVNLDKEIVSDRLFIHRDLIVRISYILGDLTLKSEMEDSLDELDEIEDDNNNTEEAEYEFKQDVPNLLTRIGYFVDEVIRISELKMGTGIDTTTEDYNSENDDDVQLLKSEIVDEVMLRFNLLTKGEKLNTKGKWVNAWYYKTNSRKEFIKTIKMFSSNAKRSWGGLLTPIVRTMRVKGNFAPGYIGGYPKLVLFDGQGLGHKTTATSMPNEIVEHFKQSDAILIVDNAQAPVLDNVKLAIRTVIEYGYASKVLFAFTHFDLMKGDNFNRFDDKRKHVVAALNSYIFELRHKNEDVFSDVEAEQIINSCYFFSELDKLEVSKVTKLYTERMLERLNQLLVESISIEDVKLKYDAMTLYAHLQIAIQKYHYNWSQIIGYPSKSSKTEQWSRIKALTRRLAYFDMDHYNNELMPLADLVSEIRTQINLFMNKPLEVIPKVTEEEVKVALINELKSKINAKLVDFIKKQMWHECGQMKRWQEAYNFGGRGSTYQRASKINEILELAAPQIDIFAYNMTDIQKE